MTSQAAIVYRITSASTVVSRACFCKQQRWVLESNRRVGVWSFPWRWHIRSINDRSRNKRRNLWVGWCVSSWWPMFTSRSSVSLYIYLYVCILYTGSGYRMYIYIHRECHSVLVELHPITVYMAGFWERAVPLLNATCCFLWFQPFVSYAMVIRLILGCLWPLVSVLNYILTLGILRSVIFHLPGCFCPWTFFQNIGFNIPSDSFMSQLYTEL